MKCLNLGCGNRFHHGWTNIDVISNSKHVIAHDLTLGIPFPEASFDVVYHSHILEHFQRSYAYTFIGECRRVLRLGGVIRIAVPDLEQIVRNYLYALEAVLEGSPEWLENYEWMVLELYDQTVRDKSGGDMAKYLQRDDLPNKEFVLSRIGVEGRRLLDRADQIDHKRSTSSWGERFAYYRKNPRRVYAKAREKLLRLTLGRDDYAALALGRFRKQGEVHYWMYDRYSLGRLLSDTGFQSVTQQSAAESFIIDWAKYDLDTEPDGSTYKSDSLYMEAIKT